MSYISDHKHGCMSDEEYRFHAQRKNAQNRDVCYECTDYGDDYRYDPELDELVSNCGDCQFCRRETDNDDV